MLIKALKYIQIVTELQKDKKKKNVCNFNRPFW